MRIFYLPRDEKANISMDFLTAVAVIIIGFVFAVSVLSSMITPYSGYSKELYPTADRAVTLLVEDEGYFNSGYDEGTDWETVWYKENYSDIKKIGFQENKESNTLDSSKVYSIMEPHGDEESTWWEYPVSSASNPETDNASRAMGIGRYNFYMQIRPIDENNFNVTEADNRAIEMVEDRGDVATVVRYSILNQHYSGGFDGAELYGLRNNNYVATKPLFGIKHENFNAIRFNGGFYFSISNWTLFNPSKDGKIKKIEIDIEIKNNDTLNHYSPDSNEYTVWKNESEFTTGDNGIVGMPIENENVKVAFFIPIETIETYIGESWDTPGNTFYVQFNVDNIEVQTGGVTWFDRTFDDDEYPVETTIWVW